MCGCFTNYEISSFDQRPKPDTFNVQIKQFPSSYPHKGNDFSSIWLQKQQNILRQKNLSYTFRFKGKKCVFVALGKLQLVQHWPEELELW